MIIRTFCILCLIFFPLLAQAEAAFVTQPDVQEFIQFMVKNHKFKKTELTSLFTNVRARPKVIQKIKAPLEQKPWYLYQTLFVTDWRIREGLEFWEKYKDVLERAEKQFGVPASLIVATIGIETKYGRITGDYSVLEALVNLAFGDSSRKPFFRKELKEFLLLTREHNLNPRKVTGSYAGAIGQPQFMPSSYRNYAVNFSGSGKVDLSHDVVDVIGSIANYYQKNGWQTSQPIAAPANNTGKYRIHFTRKRSISKDELMDVGLLPKDLKNQKYKIIQLQGFHGNEYWLGYHNFNVIKRYNSSDLYAMAVYQLSYHILAYREKKNYGSWL